jgi:Arc/MetJ-type ribon-helix-helix transcriptional regulator
MEGDGSKKYVDKQNISVTVNEGRVARIDALVDSGKYRNRSHAVDEAVRLLLEKEDADAARTG